MTVLRSESENTIEKFILQLPVPDAGQAVRVALDILEKENFSRRLWTKDASIWSAEKAVQENVRNRLGWLEAPAVSQAVVSEIESFVEEIRGEKFKHVVLLGMGGSSLAPDMFSKTFPRGRGYPKLIVLDSIDAGAIKNVTGSIALDKSLFIVSSKSGTTIETDSLYLYFYELVKRKFGSETGKRFVAITDTGSPLEKLALEANFSRVFRAPLDVGGRYSALTYFGLVPAALMGVDVRLLLERAQKALLDFGSDVPLSKNSAALFGVALAECAKSGRDKLTFFLPQALSSLGDWIEQLVAESTGKLGKGILPILSEPELPAGCYGDDRFFVFTRLKGVKNNPPRSRPAWPAGRQSQLVNLKHPCAEFLLKDLYDLGYLFFFWELATAVAGRCLEVDPFDEPNVSESKQITKALLLNYAKDGKLRTDAESYSVSQAEKLKSALAKILATLKKGDYLAFMIFGAPSEKVENILCRARASLLKEEKVASTVGFGPRYLHSTGQLHKGGPSTGVFIQLAHEDVKDLAIPGKSYSFEVLKRAQALGDFESLKNRGRRVIQILLRGSLESELRKFANIFLSTIH